MKTVLTLCLVLALAPTSAHSQQRGKVRPAARPQSSLQQQCARMQQMQRGWETAIRVQDDRLRQLTQTMDNAFESQRVAAMADVIHELVAQRTAQRTLSEQMRSALLGHVREHLQQGGRDDLQLCPLLNGRYAP
jgi:hypothetical protein